MKVPSIIFVFASAMLMASCGPVQPTTTPPTVTSATVAPSATLTGTSIPAATFTPLPPTATASPTATVPPTFTATPIATATASPKPTATPTPSGFLQTQDLPPIPKGMGAVIVTNYFSQELGLDIGSKFYKIPAPGRMVIFLSPGRYTFSVAIPGYDSGNGIIDVFENNYTPEDFYGS